VWWCSVNNIVGDFFRVYVSSAYCWIALFFGANVIPLSCIWRSWHINPFFCPYFICEAMVCSESRPGNSQELHVHDSGSWFSTPIILSWLSHPFLMIHSPASLSIYKGKRPPRSQAQVCINLFIYKTSLSPLFPVAKPL